ncbi:carbon-nitrogen hydrolase family protein [Luteococcus sediminum]
MRVQQRSSPFRAALGQWVAGPDPQENLRRVERDVVAAAAEGAELLVLPEASMLGFAHDPRPLAEPLDGPWASRVRELARTHDLLVVVGMFRPAGDGRVHNTVLATDGRDVEAHYDKVHLYDAFGTRESDRTAPGERLVTFEALGTRIGLATCYDVRFADQFTALGRAGAELVCLPTAWADGPRKAEQWRLLVRARAMDCQAFVLGCDQALDEQAGTSFGVGASLVAGPLGEVLAEAGPGPQLLVAELDLAQVRQTRATVPILG